MHQIIAGPQIITAKTLTASNFGPFGYVVENPANTSPTHESLKRMQPTPANQGTALKYSEISPIIDNYAHSPNRLPSKSIMSMFVCSPRPLESVIAVNQARLRNMSTIQGVLGLSILERHLYTTQTFIPLGLNPDDTRTSYLVVVAPTKSGPSEDAGLPDVSRTQAFIARGSQAITYGVGIWHAPMMVVGESPVDFVVTQHVNGMPGDDCEEIELTKSGTGGISIAVPYQSVLPVRLASRSSKL